MFGIPLYQSLIQRNVCSLVNIKTFIVYIEWLTGLQYMHMGDCDCKMYSNLETPPFGRNFTNGSIANIHIGLQGRIIEMFFLEKIKFRSEIFTETNKASYLHPLFFFGLFYVTKCILMFHNAWYTLQGLYSLSGRTFHCNSSWCLEVSDWLFSDRSEIWQTS